MKSRSFASRMVWPYQTVREGQNARQEIFCFCWLVIVVKTYRLSHEHIVPIEPRAFHE